MAELDEINKEILRLLCEDSRFQYSELKKRLDRMGHELTREAGRRSEWTLLGFVTDSALSVMKEVKVNK